MSLQKTLAIAILVAVSAPGIAAAKKPTELELVERGGAIFNAWSKKYPSMRVRTLGQATTPTVEVCVPRNLWKKASKADQVALTYFAEARVLGVKAHPEAHVVGSYKAAPFQSENLKKIGSGNWYISSAEMTPGSSRVVSCDENEVHGDSDWAAEVRKVKENGWRPVPESKKASVFRQPK